jgi:DNA polymerase-3 subunit gamma/tau
VKFILATTETHKVPDTIISRCQRYDFKSINEHDLIHRLNYIASEEKVTIDNDSLNYIVKNSG